MVREPVGPSFRNMPSLHNSPPSYHIELCRDLATPLTFRTTNSMNVFWCIVPVVYGGELEEKNSLLHVLGNSAPSIEPVSPDDF